MKNFPVAKWGNSSVLRIPAAKVGRPGPRYAETVGALAGRAVGWSRASFAAELDRARAAVPAGWSVTAELRRSARY